MRSRPSNVKEFIRKHKLAYEELVDASGWGVESIRFNGTKNLEPFVWFFVWSKSVTAQLCTAKNPSGKITVSDLNFLDIFMHWLALDAAVPVEDLEYESPAIWCDNLATVTWIHTFRNTNSDIATKILRALATQLHTCHSGLLSVDHLSGCYNTLADLASREHTTDLTHFLQSFTKTFPTP